MIVVECNLDELFVKTIGFDKRRIRHAGGKGKVLQELEKREKAIGIVNEDSQANQPDKMANYTRIQMEWAVTVTLMRKGSNKIVQMPPYLESWLLNKAKKNKIFPKDFGIPEDPKEFHKITHVEERDSVKKFVTEIVKIDAEIQSLKNWIETSLQ